MGSKNVSNPTVGKQITKELKRAWNKMFQIPFHLQTEIERDELNEGLIKA